MVVDDQVGELGPAVLDVVALLDDVPKQGLSRGAGGTVVERLDGTTMLVEFSDDAGRAYAITILSPRRIAGAAHRPRGCLKR